MRVDEMCAASCSVAQYYITLLQQYYCMCEVDACALAELAEAQPRAAFGGSSRGSCRQFCAVRALHPF